ncbi:MAG: helix-turn-helix domain-containing protein [Bacilli bacterium]|nr:helix-turn-helix domain-containing protein [Bacilli bacterium]
MNLIKIGKFIAESRKNKNLTQEELAEKLFITDRAVSKWERGLSLPDADKMLDLCNILDINVNELLIGEKIDMKDNEKKTEELLLELAKQEEIKNKKIMTSMWVIMVLSTLFYVALLIVSIMLFIEGPILGAIIVVATMVLCCSCFYALKLEVEAGYYECKKCHHRHVPSYKQVLWAPHMATTRYLKCPKCGKRSWSKKVMTK